MNASPTEKALIVTGLCAVLVAGLVGVGKVLADQRTAMFGPPAQRSHASWAYDVGNDVELVGHSDYVFVGHVLTSAPGPSIPTNEPTESYPTTMYTISPELMIKGVLSESMVVRQTGGYDSEGRLHVIEDDELLAAGSRYLVVGRMVDGALNLSAGQFSHYLADDADERAELIARFTSAVLEAQTPSPTGVLTP